jgi:glycosyltransferase involved in cell wall biosynthesis
LADLERDLVDRAHLAMPPPDEALDGCTESCLPLGDEEGLVQLGDSDCGLGHRENLDDAPVRILLVSQMYPSAAAPDFGVFVQGLERELAARGHVIERVVLDRRGGGKLRHAKLAARAVRAARRFRPDVVYAHFLFPAGFSGLLAARASRAPLVVTAHGQDVANLTEYPFVRPPARRVVRGAAAVIAVSEWLRGRLVESIAEAVGKTEVVNCGVDLNRFRPLERTPGRSPAFLCVGSLIERKNVVRLADAFGRLGEGTLTFVGDGPLRPRLEGRPGVSVTGYVAHDAVSGYLAAADVLCQPSLVEPFGQATLEGLACARSVVATSVGGPPEFVPAGAGVLVDPLDEAALAAALREAAALPVPNPAAREAAEPHDVRLQAARVETILVEAILERTARRGRRA